MSDPKTVSAALTQMEETMLDMRAVATLLMLTAESNSQDAHAICFIGRQVYDWEAKMHAAFERLWRARGEQNREELTG